MIDAVLSEGVIGRARVNGLVDVKARDLRDYTSDKHGRVDDMPFGGGPGMVLKPEPLFGAVESILESQVADPGRGFAGLALTPGMIMVRLQRDIHLEKSPSQSLKQHAGNQSVQVALVLKYDLRFGQRNHDGV